MVLIFSILYHTYVLLFTYLDTYSLTNSHTHTHTHTHTHSFIHSFIHSSTAWSRVLLEKLTGSQLVRNTLHFMEPDGSLPHSQEPAFFPYPKPDQSILCPHPTS